MPEATLPSPPTRPPADRSNFFPVNISTENNFGFLRLLFAVLVIFAHSYPLACAGPDPLARLTHGQLDLGAFSVDMFFAISGFLIAGSWTHSRSFGDYLKKRALRIFPGLAGAVLFCVFIVGPLAGANLHTYFRAHQTYAFLRTMLPLHEIVHTLPGVFIHNPLNPDVDGSLWTIKYETTCYLLLALLGIAGILKRRGVVLLLLVASLIAVARFHCMPTMASHWYGDALWLPRFTLYFLCGTALYLWRAQMPRSPILLAVCVAALAASCRSHLEWTLPLAAYVVLYVAYEKRIKTQWLNRFGDLSYGVYLYAFPCQQLIISFRHGHVAPGLVFLTALPVSCLLGFMSWHLIEKPFLKLKVSRRANPVPALEASTPAREVPVLARLA